MNNIRLSVFTLVFLLSLFLPVLNAQQDLPFTNPQTAISLYFNDVDLKDILKIFSIQSGLNFIASESVQDRKITLYLDKVPIQEAMDKIFKANNLSYELDKTSNIFIVKDWGKPQIETITRVFYLKYATVSNSRLKQERKGQIESTDQGSTGTTSSTSSSSSTGGEEETEDNGIVDAVKKLLSEAGSVVENARTNSLIVTDVPARMTVISQAIALLDVRIPQVMLEVEMLDVNKDATDKIGVKFGSTPVTLNTVMQGAIWANKFPFGTWFGKTGAPTTEGSFSVNPSTNPSNYQILLDFLKTQSDTKVLARPKILTLNNETAEINITTNEAIGVTTTTSSTGGSSGSTTQEAERVETGVSLRVTPQINSETGEVTMLVVPKVAQAATGGTFTTSGTTSITFKDPETRSTKSIVMVKDGETIIMGGLIRKERSETITRLPFFSDIPILGRLFTHRYKDKDKDRELLVFITPRIVKDNNIELAQAKNINIPEREQSTASGIDRSDAINTSLNNFEKKRK